MSAGILGFQNLTALLSRRHESSQVRPSSANVMRILPKPRSLRTKIQFHTLVESKRSNSRGSFVKRRRWVCWVCYVSLSNRVRAIVWKCRLARSLWRSFSSHVKKDKSLCYVHSVVLTLLSTDAGVYSLYSCP